MPEELCPAVRGAPTAVRSLRTAAKRSPHSLRLEKATKTQHSQKQIHKIIKKKIIKNRKVYSQDVLFARVLQCAVDVFKSEGSRQWLQEARAALMLSCVLV